MKDKKLKIFNATIEVVAKRGFHNTPMALIAEKANVGAGTIYRYFKNKDELLNELHKYEMKNLFKAISKNDSANLPIRERFENMWINTLKYSLNHLNEVQFLRQYFESPYYSSEMKENIFEIVKPLHDFFELAIKNQIIKEMPDEILFLLTFEAAVHLALKQLKEFIAIDDKVINLTFNACWDAIKR